MPKNQIASHPYKHLLRELKTTLSSGLVSARKVLEYQRVKTYWTIGKKIRQSVSASNGALTLHEDLYRRINNDIRHELGLDLTVDLIGRSIQFNKAYPKFPRKTPLTFTHYLALMRVADEDKRLQLEQQAIKTHMTSTDIKDAVAAINIRELLPVKNTKSLAVERGIPFVYQISPSHDLNGRRILEVDCGFKINVALNGGILRKRISTVSTQCRVVYVVKENGTYHVRLNRKRKLKPYTYPAVVTRVVDGDTIDVRIDVGFGIGLNDRLRLKGINAPKIKTEAGLRAKRFLAGYLSKCPMIIIRTNKEGVYGRWLADIFALPRSKNPYKIAADGEYVNQMLLDKNLAEIY